jgi:hypothetical protein
MNLNVLPGSLTQLPRVINQPSSLKKAWANFTLLTHSGTPVSAKWPVLLKTDDIFPSRILRFVKVFKTRNELYNIRLFQAILNILYSTAIIIKFMKNPWKLAFFSLILMIAIGGLAYYLGSSKIISFNLPKETITPTPSPLLDLEAPIATPSTVSDEKLIKEALYRKFNLDETRLLVTINQLTASHAKGLVKEVEAISGGYFIAAKTTGGWVIVYDGQAHPTCAQIEPYNFPKEMVDQCLNASGVPITR